jgi:Domain of unknown function (DUF4276)
MVRLLVHVEGETEEGFVNEILREHLITHGYENVGARLVGNARQRHRRGGIRGWGAVKRDIVRHLREDVGCVATTMVDYYGLPKSGPNAWPGREHAASVSFDNKARTVENALTTDIAMDVGNKFLINRFVPFVVMHEFEGLLFSDCAAFARGVGSAALREPLQAIRNQFATPEEINDSPVTAPSKRVLQLIPGYQKPLFGNLAALEIGLEGIREECPNFRAWLARLEALIDRA